VSGQGPLTLGTAGHIDHGKTALVKELTGTDTDRLPEERARRISIALGYASMDTPSGRSLSIIDVPGHERFVRTMVAGATGIDLFLMVIAADDGVMPQTVEHATVLNALAVRRGVVAITKADLASPETAIHEARELLPDCPAIACSALTGRGLDELVAAIDRLAREVPSRADSTTLHTVLHIDRVFTLKGHGSIVTGSLWSGTLTRGQTLTLLPADVPVRVRGVEVHDKAVAQARAGQRVAVNLAGLRRREIHRGDVLATRGALGETYILDCALELTAATHNQRIHAHHGTRHTPGHLAALGENLWQLRLDYPFLAADGDRIVVRRASPLDTIGGGVVLDAHPRRHGRQKAAMDRLARLRDGRPVLPVEPPVAVSRGECDQRSFPPLASPHLIRAAEKQLLDTGFQPLSAAQLATGPGILRALRDEGKVVRVSGELYLHTRTVVDAESRVRELLQRQSSVTLAEVRDHLDVSRKSAQALLEHFDNTGMTRRLPDNRRVLSQRRRAR
jgi:selenocysteine-specific elongation factor